MHIKIENCLKNIHPGSNWIHLLFHQWSRHPTLGNTDFKSWPMDPSLSDSIHQPSPQPLTCHAHFSSQAFTHTQCSLCQECPPPASSGPWWHPSHHLGSSFLSAAYLQAASSSVTLVLDSFFWPSPALLSIQPSRLFLREAARALRAASVCYYTSPTPGSPWLHHYFMYLAASSTQHPIHCKTCPYSGTLNLEHLRLS